MRPLSSPRVRFTHPTTRYQKNNEEVWISDIETLKYKLITGRFCGAFHLYLKDFVFRGDNIKISDYNTDTLYEQIDTTVILSSSYAPEIFAGTKLASVELEFNNTHKVIKKRC